VPDSIKALSDLGECVKAFSDLPNRVLADQQFLPGSKEEKELIEGIREVYYWTEQWLSYYLLDQHQIKPQLGSTDGKHFQSHAKLCMARYRLCEEVYRYPGWAKQFFCSPAGLWLTCEYELCQGGLENCGLIGGAVLVSKTEFAANMAQFWGKQSRGEKGETTGRLREPEKLREIYPGYKPGTPVEHVSPRHMLILTASYLAGVDSKFRYGVYQDYWKAGKRHARAILNNKNLGRVCITPWGDLIDTQSTANLPGSRLEKRKKKGFGKKQQNINICK
jgi:hypothetical protein